FSASLDIYSICPSLSHIKHIVSTDKSSFLLNPSPTFDEFSTSETVALFDFSYKLTFSLQLIMIYYFIVWWLFCIYFYICLYYIISCIIIIKLFMNLVHILIIYITLYIKLYIH